MKTCVFCGKTFAPRKSGRSWFRSRCCSKCTRWFNVARKREQKRRGVGDHYESGENMRPGGGKRKGGTFEREIAKELSVWWMDGACDHIVFWRTHSSGQLGTRGHHARTEYGDIMAVDDAGKDLTDRLNIELRHARELNISDLVYGSDKCGMAKFIQEGRRNAEMSKREPLWIFKEHLGPIMVMMDPRSLHTLGIECIVHGIAGAFPRWDVFVMSFEDWKKYFDKTKLKVSVK